MISFFPPLNTTIVDRVTTVHRRRCTIYLQRIIVFDVNDRVIIAGVFACAGRDAEKVSSPAPGELEGREQPQQSGANVAGRWQTDEKPVHGHPLDAPAKKVRPYCHTTVYDTIHTNYKGRVSEVRIVSRNDDEENSIPIKISEKLALGSTDEILITRRIPAIRVVITQPDIFSRLRGRINYGNYMQM